MPYDASALDPGLADATGPEIDAAIAQAQQARAAGVDVEDVKSDDAAMALDEASDDVSSCCPLPRHLLTLVVQDKPAEQNGERAGEEEDSDEEDEEDGAVEPSAKRPKVPIGASCISYDIDRPSQKRRKRKEGASRFLDLEVEVDTDDEEEEDDDEGLPGARNSTGLR
jgi:hypothetical protein